MKSKFLLLMISCLCLCGCGAKERTPSELSDDTILFSLKNYNSTFYTQLGGAMYIPFELISGKELNEDDIFLAIDIKTPYRWGLDSQKEIEELPYYVYQNYQDIDWNKMCELYLDCGGDDALNVKAIKLFNDYSDSHLESYRAFRDKKGNQGCYYYSGGIVFDFATEDAVDESFSQITFTIAGQKHCFDIGNIELNYTLTLPETIPALQATIYAIHDKPVYPNKHGLITIDGQLVCDEDVYITGFRLLNANAEIRKISLVIEGDGKSIDLLFSGEPIFCKKGNIVKTKITVFDSKFKDQLFYSNTFHVLVDHEYNGDKSSEFFHANYRTVYGFHELVAMLYDNIDFLPYFNQYYSVIEGIN